MFLIEIFNLLSVIIIGLLISILVSTLYLCLFHLAFKNKLLFKILPIGFAILVFLSSHLGYASSDLYINIELPKTKITQNCPFELNIIAQWDGEPYDYLIPFPSLNFPDTFSVIDTATKTKALVNGKQQIIFAYQIIASEIGEYKLDSLKLNYIPRDEVDKYIKNLSIITIKVFPWNIWGLTLKHLAIIFCFVLLFMILGYFLLRRKKNSTKKKILEIEKGEREKELYNILEKVRAAKICGDNMEFLEKIILFKKNLKIEYDNEKKMLESLKYAGYKISKEKIEYLYRDIEHILKNRRE